MSRRDFKSQIDRGLLSPNVAALLLDCCANSIRRWATRGFVVKIQVPFSNDIQFSAFQILAAALQWNMKFRPELITAAKNYARYYKPEFLPRLEALEQAYWLDYDNTYKDFFATYRQQNQELGELSRVAKPVTNHNN